MNSLLTMYEIQIDVIQAIIIKCHLDNGFDMLFFMKAIPQLTNNYSIRKISFTIVVSKCALHTEKFLAFNNTVCDGSSNALTDLSFVAIR